MKYNGHRNYNAWNVSLWINNDEGLYLMARDLKRAERSSEKAAVALLENLREIGLVDTPDGVPFTKTNLILALRGL